MRRKILVLVCTSALALLAAGNATAAPAKLHTKWRLVTRNVTGLTGSGRFVGYTERRARSYPFVLIDDVTGHTTILSRNGCVEGALSTTWVAFQCGAGAIAFQLYNIQTHKWRVLGCYGQCAANLEIISVIGVGAKWLALYVSPHSDCGPATHKSVCGPPGYYFLNIATRKLRTSVMQTARKVVDLSSSSLLRPLCAPLRIEPGPQTSYPPAVTFHSGFAVAQQASGVYVERCGSRMQIRLGPSSRAGHIVAGQRAVALCTGSGVSGVWMPSRRRFSFGLPFGQCPVLGAANIYVIDVHGRLWSATFPASRSRAG
jgi:hypothetical protein